MLIREQEEILRNFIRCCIKVYLEELGDLKDLKLKDIKDNDTFDNMNTDELKELVEDLLGW